MKLIKFILPIIVIFLFNGCRKTQPCIDYDKVDPIAVCDNSFDPVCGCDDFTYPNKCIAEKNGVVAWIGGPCP
jgi:hypothetical protein